MAKNIKDLPTSVLMTYQQVVGMANQQMDGFATEVEAMLERKEIGESYYEEMKKRLLPKFERNSEILTEIDKELFSRITRDLKDVTTPKIMTSLYKSMKESKDIFDKANPKKEKGKGLNLKPVK